MAYQMPPGYYPPMPPGYYPPMPAGPILASFGRRLGALIIDGIIIGIVAFIIAVALNVPGVQQTTTFGATETTTFSLTNSGWAQVILAVVSGVYCLGTWLSIAGTPAQRMLGMHVYRVSGPVALAPEAAVIRWLLLFGVFSGIGALAVASPDISGVVGLGQLAWVIVLIVTTMQSPMKQGLHDRLAGSIVVRN